MKAILVDDDFAFCEMFLVRLQEGAQNRGIAIECDVCHNPKEVLQQHIVYDVYFIDIEMAGMNGLELAEEMRARYVNAEIIFLSFHEQYVWHSFHVRPGAFIRKAWLDTDLPEALEAVKKQEEKIGSVIEVTARGNVIERIRPMEILYCKSEEHYVRFVWEDRESRLYRMKLDQAEEKLLKFQFLRTHSRYLVNTEYICGLSVDKVMLADNLAIPVSRTYKRKVQMAVMNLREQKRKK
ncbi:MAG: LytTR family DNA-binding domain-containing protein [Lachnospiraceae bacterium]|nr:LytTR family DNA-binding domain-containing protein [Lachnospiraceae bacterium]